jgi:hypothetical protein
MTQKDMEARLIALEAEYAQKKLEADAQIRREQKEIAQVEANYHNAVRHHKDVIRTLEQAKQLLNVQYLEEKQDIYAEFARSEE